MDSSKEAVALRDAAVHWANASRLTPSDDKDSEFQKIDRKLFRAAIAYTKHWLENAASESPFRE